MLAQNHPVPAKSGAEYCVAVRAQTAHNGGTNCHAAFRPRFAGCRFAAAGYRVLHNCQRL